MRLALFLLTLPLAAQITITASKQGDELPLVLVGKVPQTVTPYLLLACNNGSALFELSPDLAVQQIALKGFAVQHGEAVLNAARAWRGGRAKVIAYNFALPFTSIAPGGALIERAIRPRRDQLAAFPDPPDWWIPGGPSVPLLPSRCHPLLIALEGRPVEKNIVAGIGGTVLTTSISYSGPTHPQVSDEDFKLAAMRAADAEFWERALGVSQ